MNKLFKKKGYAHNKKVLNQIVRKSQAWSLGCARRHDNKESSCTTANRAPTLHRLGIQAFEPILVEGIKGY